MRSAVWVRVAASTSLARLFIAPTQSSRHQSRQMIHGDTLGPIWSERGMREPGKNGSGPAEQVEIRQLIPIERFKCFQNRTHFFLGMSGHDAKGALGIQTATKLSEDECQAARRFP
jgi:hypothetical protein